MKYLIPILLLAGCATTDEQMRMAIAAQQNVKPTLKVTCPAGGCEVEYTDPRERHAIKLPTNGWDFAGKVTDTVGGLVNAAIVPAAFAYTAAKGFDALKGSGAVTTNTNTATTTSTSNQSTATSTTTTLSGTGVIGDGTNSIPTTSTSTTTTTDNSSTATPTVVNPVIVRP